MHNPPRQKTKLRLSGTRHSALGTSGFRDKRARTSAQCLVPSAYACLMGTFLLFALSGRAFAQAPPKVEFDEAITRALEKNPTIAQAATVVTRAEALMAQSRALTLPSIGASLTSVTLDGSRGFEGTTTQPQSQLSIGGAIRYQSGLWYGVNQARDQVDVANLSVAEVRQRIAIGTAEAYLAVVAARRQVEVADRSLEAARAHLEYAQKRLEGGVGSRLNQLRAAQAVTVDEGRLETFRLALRRAQEALGVFLVNDGPVDAGAEPVFETPTDVDPASLAASRPDLRTQTAIQRAAERVVKDHWTEWAPFPSVAFTPVAVAPAGLFQPSRSWTLSINLTQPLFDGGERRALLRQRQAAVDQAKFEFSSLEVQARSDVRVARDTIETLQRVAATARLSADQANEVLRISTTAFEVGATTNIEVIDAQRVARDSETAAAIAEDAVRRARLDLLVALGRFPK
jgi:outer membrane protein TolC